MYTEHKHSNTQHGFTLIEIVVSLALFSVVAVVAIGAFLKIIAANRRAQAIETAVNDAGFALESLVRDLRVGTDYQCIAAVGSMSSTITSPSITTCSPGLNPNIIEFNSSQTAAKSGGGVCSLIHAYQLSGNTIQKAEQQTCAQAFGSGSYNFVPVTSTSSNLKIQSFLLRVDGTLGSVQPKVFIVVSGTAGVSEADKTAFTIQTTATQRVMQ